MKQIAWTTALVLTGALGLAAPAAASDSLARSLGVEPGSLTTNELVQLRNATEDGNQARIRLILARAEAARVEASADDQPRYEVTLSARGLPRTDLR